MQKHSIFLYIGILIGLIIGFVVGKCELVWAMPILVLAVFVSALWMMGSVILLPTHPNSDRIDWSRLAKPSEPAKL